MDIKSIKDKISIESLDKERVNIKRNYHSNKKMLLNLRILLTKAVVSLNMKQVMK